MRRFCTGTAIALTVGCGRDVGGRSGAADLDKTFTEVLESSWNFYGREKIFLGPTYFGNTTSFARTDGSLHALALLSDYGTYRALATKGLIRLDELSVGDAPPSVFSGGAKIERAATVSLTDAGSRAGVVDKEAKTVTFTLATYRVEKIVVNTVVAACEGTYRLVEGTSTLDIKPEFADVWAELGRPRIRDGRFRALFQFDTTDFLYKNSHQGWRVPAASNGRFSAQDTGPLAGNYESNNVPPTVERIQPKVCVVR